MKKVKVSITMIKDRIKINSVHFDFLIRRIQQISLGWVNKINLLLKDNKAWIWYNLDVQLGICYKVSIFMTIFLAKIIYSIHKFQVLVHIIWWEVNSPLDLCEVAEIKDIKCLILHSWRKAKINKYKNKRQVKKRIMI
jgi:hypothetical protein